jgi:hypothetical protein
LLGVVLLLARTRDEHNGRALTAAHYEVSLHHCTERRELTAAACSSAEYPCDIVVVICIVYC